MERVGGGVAPVFTSKKKSSSKKKAPAKGAQGTTPIAPAPNILASVSKPVLPSIDTILANDPIYLAKIGALNANSVADKATRDASLRRALIDFGGPLDFSSLGSDMGGVWDPTTQALAQKNTAAGLSVLARLKAAADDAQRQTLNNLGARGLFNSGETGWNLNRLQLASTQAQYDARSRLLDYFAGVQAAWVAAERQRQAERDAAAQDTIDNTDTSQYRPPVSIKDGYNQPVAPRLWDLPKLLNLGPPPPPPPVVKKKAPPKYKKPSPYGV